MNSLRELQRAFGACLLDRQGPAPAALAPAAASDPAVRFGLYHEGYRLRLIESLATDYPATRVLLGADRFDASAREFVETHRSAYFNLRWYGAEFAGFLSSVGSDDAPLAGYMAAFEWALAGAFDAADTMPMTVDEMASVRPDAWPTLRFDFHSSLRRLPLPEPVPELWRALLADPPGPGPTLSADLRIWLVWRKDLSVVYRCADTDEVQALEQAAGGSNFADICAVLSAHGGESATAVRAATLLRRWVADGLVVGVRAEVL